VPKPANVTFEQAASVLTALRDVGRVQSGQKVLITGATGVILIKAPLLSLVVSPKIRHVSEAPNQDDLLALKEFMESRKVTPIVGSTYPLSRTPEAIAYFAKGHALGKVVITM
jgi:NADPH:quinone reductase-like Zn-dependent oxidoreductase